MSPNLAKSAVAPWRSLSSLSAVDSEMMVWEKESRTLAPTYESAPSGRSFRLLAILALGLIILTNSIGPPVNAPPDLSRGLEECEANSILPAPAVHRRGRTHSDRYVDGTSDVFIRNATIWTGGNNGTEVLYDASVLLSKGLVKAFNPSEKDLKPSTDIIDADRAWVTPGIVDMHSHAGQLTFPLFAATNTLVSKGGMIMPYSRSIDSFDTHDLAFRLVTSGGTTTSLILPGSGSDMGGEAWAMKFRNTSGNSPSSMAVEPAFEVDSKNGYRRTSAWRNAKHAMGENVSKNWKDLGGTRQDNMYYMRAAYASATLKKQSQNGWCTSARALQARKVSLLIWPFNRRPTVDEYRDLGAYPDSTLEEELLVDALRGKVRIHVHAYESTDLDALMRLSQEFKVPIASIQHAHEAWFSIETLKQFYGNVPSVAMFSTSSIYKHEAYRHSLFAPILLAEQGIPVIFKSDHPPAVDSRYLVAEAALGHYFGLATNLAMMSVTSAPAAAIGLDHRVGYLLPGYDADVVIWNSHPLSLGATPIQVYVDGMPQLQQPTGVQRTEKTEEVPESADFSQQIQAARDSHHGDVDLQPVWTADSVKFINVSSYIYRKDKHLEEAKYDAGTLVVESGEVTCAGSCDDLVVDREVDLHGGAISPGLTLFGTSLGLIEINEEPSTTDQDLAPLSLVPPSGAVHRAVDGVVFGGKEPLISIRAGITNAITPPMSSNIFKGYSMYTSVMAPHRLHPGAILQDKVAYHVSIGHAPIYPATPDGLQVSSQISALRTLLLNDAEDGLTPTEELLKGIARGEKILVIFVSSADQMASLIQLKKEVEDKYSSTMMMVFDGALEAHLIADQIAAANIGVITRERGNPVTWDDRRALPSLPLSEDTNISALRKAGVTVGIGMTGSRASTSTLRFYLAYSMTDTTHKTTALEAFELATTNLESLLGVSAPPGSFVATEFGGLLEIGKSRIVAAGAGDGKILGF